jgi:23S rRNA pseudouridine2604 synthase
MTDGIRLNKRMAELGLCSRREADDWIAKGWVRVNGQVAQLGLPVQPTDDIRIERAATQAQQQQVTILLNKPIGYVSGQAEDGHEPAITLIQAKTQWRGAPSHTRFTGSQLRGLAPAGRLDIDSTGLLVLTQDGRVARQLIGEDSSMEKEYLVRVEYTGQTLVNQRGNAQVVTRDVQNAFPAQGLAKLRHGLSLDGKALKPAKVDWQNPEQLRFVLTEGKKRQIRRMCELVGLKVVALKRVRMGHVMLGNLPMGQWRYLEPGERF